VWRPADIERALSQPRTLREHGHRPFPLPKRPWVMGQTWEDLLFAHWRVDPDALRPVIPPQIPIDTFEGSAWIAVTPFMVTGLRARLTLPLPGTSRFPEVNVRTYTTIGGRPGIWFFSLDTSNRPAVETARRVYRLPYFRSRMDVRHNGERVRFQSERVSADGPPAACEVEYEAVGPVAAAEPGSFEEFACERYCLYTLDDAERVLRGTIHHPPWPLQPAEATFARNTMAEQIGIALEGEPTLHVAARQDVLFWLNRPVERG
jgi:uncharacterized protein YqjF (DUF2071 family)